MVTIVSLFKFLNNKPEKAMKPQSAICNGHVIVVLLLCCEQYYISIPAVLSSLYLGGKRPEEFPGWILLAGSK